MAWYIFSGAQILPNVNKFGQMKLTANEQYHRNFVQLKTFHFSSIVIIVHIVIHLVLKQKKFRRRWQSTNRRKHRHSNFNCQMRLTNERYQIFWNNKSRQLFCTVEKWTREMFGQEERCFSTDGKTFQFIFSFFIFFKCQRRFNKQNRKERKTYRIFTLKCKIVIVFIVVHLAAANKTVKK